MLIADIQKELRSDIEKHGLVERPADASFNDDPTKRELGQSNASTYTRFDVSAGGKLLKGAASLAFFHGRDHYDAGSPTDAADIEIYRTRNQEINTQIIPGLNSAVPEQQAQIEALEAEVAKNDNIITEIENRASSDDFLDDPNTDEQDLFNPDFASDTIGFSYFFGGFKPPSERGLEEDGVETGFQAPNASYPANKNNTYVAPHKGRGGFGTDASDMPTVSTNVDTYKIISKYQ